MPYKVEQFNNVEVEEFVTGWILRLTFPQGHFKFYAPPQGESDVVIYIGHGTVNIRVKRAIRQWADNRGIKHIHWGREKALDRHG